MTFDPYDPEVQALMAGKAEAQGQAVGVGRDPWKSPSLGQAVMARRAADPTTVLDDFDAEHEDMRRAAEPAWGGTRMYVQRGGRWIPAGGVVSATLFVGADPHELVLGLVQAGGAIADALQPVAAKAAGAIREVSVKLEQVDPQAVAALFGVPEHMLVDTADDLARRRHGHAAVCPRHGPTKGGLCRRCQR